MNSLFDLTGKCALITGGSRGLGLQIAEAFGGAGATLVLVARKRQDLDDAVSAFADRGVEAHGIAADLRDPESIAALVDETIDRCGAIDILVNSAGATWGAPAEEHTMENWSKVMETNVTGAFLLSQAVVRRSFLPRAAGTIINVASIEGLRGHHHAMTGTVAYNTSKGALVNLTRALAGEWGVKGIRVNALAPGYFPTAMTRGTLDALGERLLDEIPLARFGGARDLMGPALLLASDAGAYINGHILVVDGGMTAI